MYIDKSFQLLSADSGKVASDEARRQNAAEDDAEFSELLGAELNQQDQQKEIDKAAASEKKSGQEVAALLTKQAKAAGQFNSEISLADQVNATVTDSEEAIVSLADNALTETALKGIVVGANDASAETDTTKASESAAHFGAEQAADSDPWLAIISQSHDFNEILSQSSQQTIAATQDAKLTSAETLAAELLDQPITDQSAATNAFVESAGQLSETVGTLSNEPKTAHGKASASQSDTANMPSDQTLLNSAQQQLAHTKEGTVDHSHANNSAQQSSTTLPAEQVTVQEMLQSDQPHQHLQPGGAVGQNRVVGPDQQAESAMAAGITTSGQPTQLQMTAANVAGQLSQTESKLAKNSATTPVDIELPIEVIPDIAALGAVVADTAKVTTSAKNAPQSFAQFQKSANAAAALVQKQLLQAEQTQQPLQDLAVQQSQKFVELNQPGLAAHADTPVAFNALLQTERPISSSGGAMGSSTGQHQQQAASQIFASKLTDSISQNEQPTLNLLEPNAASQLKERVMFQVNQKIHSAEIKLAPEELGSMQIKVQLQQEQLSVQFVVQQAGAKETLEQQMPRLREMLEEQGIQLTEGQVSQQRDGSAEQRPARERTQGMATGGPSDEEPLQHQAIVRISDRMVDYYA